MITIDWMLRFSDEVNAQEYADDCNAQKDGYTYKVEKSGLTWVIAGYGDRGFIGYGFIGYL